MQSSFKPPLTGFGDKKVETLLQIDVQSPPDIRPQILKEPYKPTVDLQQEDNDYVQYDRGSPVQNKTFEKDV